VDNPFADPSVQQVTNSSSVQRGIDDYNPFGGQQTTTTAPIRGASHPPQFPVTFGSQSAVMQPSHEPPPAYSPNSQQNLSTAEFQRRQEELERKAQELQRREEELRNAQYNVKTNNWPPLPSSFPVQPCFYQDINVDIPLEFQKTVRYLYYLWMFHSCVLLANVIGGLALLIQTGDFATFGLSLVYFVLFTPASYVCWFRPVYKAFRSDSSFNFMVFFFVFFFQFIMSVLFAIGFSGVGTCGFVKGVSLFSGNYGAGNIVVAILVLIVALGFAVIAFLDFLLMVKVHRIYRNTGASFAKAQQEFTSGVLRNEHVQSAAANVAAGAVRAQMANTTSAGSGPIGGSRY